MKNDLLWQTKLAARIHDPAEKALVLLRDPAGHEGGTSRALKRLLAIGAHAQANVSAESEEGAVLNDEDLTLARVIFNQGLRKAVYQHVQRADWWAAAADRPQFPMDEITVKTKTGEQKTLAVASWAQVRWTEQPVLIHPLTGEQVDLGKLAETEVEDLKDRSFNHFSYLLAALAKQGQPEDLRKTLLAFWRFGPDLTVSGADSEDHGKLGALWKVLPADTRIPDHSIWDHLDLTSAFAGAFAADANGEVALLAMSLGPVQSFIAAARSTSDLWAGSHLLSRLSWEAMREVCERLGPDAILFPRLRGIPQVDVWLRDQMGLPDQLFEQCEWMRGATDANPLFAAALPNRFVAVVPAQHAREIAEAVEARVRKWLSDLGTGVVSRLLKEAGFDTELATPFEQMQEQLKGFPEVHWAAVPFSLIRARDVAKQRDLDLAGLQGAMAPFFGVQPGQPCGFLNTPAWKCLSQDLQWDDKTTFFAPNPGVLYPAVYDLAERVLAAAKASRPFAQVRHEGWRCSLTGETEWLTTDRAHLQVPAGQRRSRASQGFREGTHVETLWTRLADTRPSWAKKGEHLGALAAIKRVWPTVFVEETGRALAAGERGEQKFIGRFVVSTHTMALAHQLDRWLERGDSLPNDPPDALKNAESVALPRRLTRLHGKNEKKLELAKRLPAVLEQAAQNDSEIEADQAQKWVKACLGRDARGKEVRLETYYALIMMDGDRMGEILSGKEETTISYRDSFHPKVRSGFDDRAAKHALIKAYGDQKRAMSPNRHLAISGALNDFSQVVARHVVEEEHLGRLIYAGGDDVLAMLPVADLLSVMQRLRHAYSGTLPEDATMDWGELARRPHELHCRNGFAFLRGELMRMMGKGATASTGAVIAHHQAPLAAVLRELRATEKRAKSEGGRDAFSITVIKRSGGALRLTAKWGEPLSLLAELRDFLSADGVSRRAVYNSLEWLHDLPDPRTNPDMLQSLVAYQLARQAKGLAKQLHDVADLARRLTALCVVQNEKPLEWLANYLSVAEFLARESRIETPNGAEA